MKTTFRNFLLVAAFSSLILTGCEPLEEDTTGDDPRDKYEGEWQFIESFKSTEGQSFIVTIYKDPDNSSQVILENFGNPGTENNSVTGTVTSSQIIISLQNMSNGWSVEGSGRMANVGNNSMAWTYSIEAGGDKTEYTATATRQ